MAGRQVGLSNTVRPATHRAIVCLDVEAFGDLSRTNLDQVAVRSGLYVALRRALELSQVAWTDCYHEDRGDGMFLLVPPDVPKSLLVADFPHILVAALREHNRLHRTEARIRLRLAIHAGEIHFDEHGAAGSALNFTFRLLEAKALRIALSRVPGEVALIVSEWFYQEVVLHDPAHHPDRYERVAVSVKETSATAWITVPEVAKTSSRTHSRISQPLPKWAAAPRQLPPVPAGFAGRTAEIAALTRLAEGATAPRGASAIAVIEGTAGVGKTALAVRWAHQVADRFPDGQLYVNLRGFDPTGSPVTAAEAVRGFLEALGVPDEGVPVSFAGQVAMYQRLIADRSLLVLLDNARDTEQVRPLLPSASGCVVVTSRNRLTGLITAEGAHPLSLGLLTISDARQLLAIRIGADRVAAEPEPVDEIISSCARLPLTLSITAARAATNPGFPLSTIAAELRDARDRLDAFDGGELGTDARAVFSWSYEQLSANPAALFRLLALHPGPEVTVSAAASLAAASPKQILRTLRALAQCHLIDEPHPGRFALHDLLRIYAMELAHAHESDQTRRAAVGRLLDHYLHTALGVSLRLDPRADPIALPPPRPGTEIQDVADHPAAWAWFEAELPVLLSIIQLAASTGGSHAWQLPWMLVEYLRRSGRWQEWAATHQTGLAAAEASGDRYGQARSHQGIGRASWRLGLYNEAQVHLQLALGMFGQLDGSVGEIAGTHLALSTAFENLGSAEKALRHAEQALALAGAVGDGLWQARALNRIGWYHALLGQAARALEECQQALTDIREFRDLSGEARTLDSIGYAHHLLGEHQEAAVFLEESLALRHELYDRYGEATVLTHIGDAHNAIGDSSAASAAWQAAVSILAELSHPDIAKVIARLDQIPLSAAAGLRQRAAGAAHYE
jgi:tetratricopeptide (TPR) repeat protein